jgi:hypothetical protein
MKEKLTPFFKIEMGVISFLSFDGMVPFKELSPFPQTRRDTF